MDGILVIDKPSGWTSHDVVARVRSILGIDKAGHTGTLDPQATGVLVLCLGKATKVIPFLPEGEKEYQVRMRLGSETDTGDSSGRATFSSDKPLPSIEEVRAVLASFIGTRPQRPPAYSAVKVGGVPSYRIARSGGSVDLPARDVTILRIEDIRRAGEDEVAFTVVCSRGTYIRSLCVDVGRVLGCGAHLLALRRLRSGPFSIDRAIALEALVTRPELGEESLLPIDEALSHLPEVHLSEAEAERIAHGGAVPLRSGSPEALPLGQRSAWSEGEMVRLHDPKGEVIGIGTVSKGSILPKRVLMVLEEERKLWH